MISHVFIGVTDFERAFSFYSRLMALFGSPLKFVDRGIPWAGWKPADANRPLLVIGHPYDGAPARPGNGQMVALLAPSREAVDRSHAQALELGGQCEGAPSLRPHYYGAYFRDPDGNKICVCRNEPE